jgi:hypothetical protein
MSDIIDFLERLGQDSGLRHAPRAEIERALSAMQVSPEIRAALADRDQRLLETLLGAGNVCCLINVPVWGEDEEAGEDKGEPKPAAVEAPLSRVA